MFSLPTLISGWIIPPGCHHFHQVHHHTLAYLATLAENRHWLILIIYCKCWISLVQNIKLSKNSQIHLFQFYIRELKIPFKVKIKYDTKECRRKMLFGPNLWDWVGFWWSYSKVIRKWREFGPSMPTSQNALSPQEPMRTLRHGPLIMVSLTLTAKVENFVLIVKNNILS